MQAYRSLALTFSRLQALEGAAGILGWDSQTLMPDGAAEGRADQLATLRGMIHDLLTAPATGEELARAEAEPLGDAERTNLREMRRIHRHASAVPRDLVEANSRAVLRAEMVWREARRTADFPLLLPHLAEVLRVQREIGQAKGAALGLQPYDALLDGYDPGLRRSLIDPLFAELRAVLPGLIEAARARQAREPTVLALPGPFAIERQREVCLSLMRAAGFDFRRGRLDVSLHPFCGGAVDDVRITTRYDETDLMRALMGVLHETGHALYEQGRPAAWRGQPAGEARGMSLHESQSLIIEMQAGRSREFVAFLAPLLRETFRGEGPAWNSENLYRLSTRVEPGLIRVDADEVTYPAHILLRTELETAMLAGDLSPADLPGAFNAGMRELLGLDVPNDALGCLQDIHWPGGSFGYFPTYTLGAMIAAQLFESAAAAEPDLRPALARGDFSPLLAWLRTNVHAHGSTLDTEDLLVAATGRGLASEPFLRHLRRRYVEP
ncbi:carboxypeptidase M32 [Methylobacterium nodulans]|uniref:Metal-dependent carboxypeptidase n=1 Tax=Methylobacterium nodulans (strain LMG 21967 / CNCM I-2342 / ORS 2060) TaxID=460265 RepID=B8IQ49_METNO|nr:carboxypeptidase M32 [Methylobacterium nodulans]ACL58549.1 peptidase M32 carboxypeptidase Taq metallopeptidase [Methylobacterium nodulans ORS 2060]